MWNIQAGDGVNYETSNYRKSGPSPVRQRKRYMGDGLPRNGQSGMGRECTNKIPRFSFRPKQIQPIRDRRDRVIRRCRKLWVALRWCGVRS